MRSQQSSTEMSLIRAFFFGNKFLNIVAWYCDDREIANYFEILFSTEAFWGINLYNIEWTHWDLYVDGVVVNPDNKHSLSGFSTNPENKTLLLIFRCRLLIA